MLYPTIGELTKGDFNRYELSLATARCARLVTDEYVKQREDAEKSQTGNKETDKPVNTLINKELRDEKAVKTAIRRLHDGESASGILRTLAGLLHRLRQILCLLVCFVRALLQIVQSGGIIPDFSLRLINRSLLIQDGDFQRVDGFLVRLLFLLASRQSVLVFFVFLRGFRNPVVRKFLQLRPQFLGPSAVLVVGFLLPG
jgi:DNA-directed RNA polymerase subunit K/omega